MMLSTNSNLTRTDCYKMGHMTQYPDGTEYVYSSLEPRFLGSYAQLSRINDKWKPLIDASHIYYFGLSYYLDILTKPVTIEDKDAFLAAYRAFMLSGSEGVPEEVVSKIDALIGLGYFPLEIKSVPEFNLYPHSTPLLTVVNTHPDYAWLVGYVECLLLKLWYPISVATLSYNYKLLATHWANKTIDDAKVEGYLSYCIHDFGYRGCSSDETAAIGGMSHLIHFPASDTLKGWECLKVYYPERAKFTKPLSVQASEHSISCAYGLANEEGYFRSLLTKFKSGALSLISDTYDIFDVCDRILPSMKDLIEARSGPTVIRHDSGDQVKVLCGDDTKTGLQAKGTLQILADRFGFYINEKGYKVLNDKVRVIWGDGFNLDTYCNVFSMMESQGWSAENLVVGVGALLLNLHNRDDHGFAFKASQVTVNGAIRNIQKNPATDSTKKSKIGRIKVTKEGDAVHWMDGFNTEPSINLLQTVFLNGKITKKELS